MAVFVRRDIRVQKRHEAEYRPRLRAEKKSTKRLGCGPWTCLVFLNSLKLSWKSSRVDSEREDRLYGPFWAPRWYSFPTNRLPSQGTMPAILLSIFRFYRFPFEHAPRQEQKNYDVWAEPSGKRSQANPPFHAETAMLRPHRE
ncbi:hypothetical protein HL42_4609 [Trichophyton rubrum]|nr:hypothetical protein HL42_4609 [Trichophyton rubrum]